MNWFHEGEQMKLDAFFTQGTRPILFYLRLFNDTPQKTDTIAALLGEPSGNGYQPQQLNADDIDWPSIALDGGDMKISSKTVEFIATGAGWGPVNVTALTTSSGGGGKAILWKELSQPRTLLAGENLKITAYDKET